jgi:hypothetical protein
MRASLAWACAGASLVAGCGGSAFTSGDGQPDGAAPIDATVGPDGGPSAEGGGTPDATLVCPSSEIDCGGRCINPSNDPGNCGGCSSMCTGGTCAAGVCKLVVGAGDAGVPVVGDFACLAVDARSVYVATGLAAAVGGQIYKVPLGGGPPQTIVPNLNMPHGIATDGQSLFWANNGSGEIWKSDTSGGSASAIVTGQLGPLYVVLDASHIYWNSGGDGTVWQANRDGSASKQLASGLSVNHLGYIAADLSSVYYTDLLAGTVSSVPINGGNSVLVAQGQGRPTGLAVGALALYWSNATSGTIMRQALGVAVGPPTPIASSLATPNALALDGLEVYLSQNVQLGSVAKVPTLGGGAVTTLAGNQPFPSCIAVDSTSVYWIDTGGGTVSKTGK